ncbi:murein L,D-transpeptidase catalytic domain family protein [Sphingobacterium sp. Mn56C]|uniref:murein L,D-transpeptidase catalytic domain family protein n=1 Tax=Sphingobacterium sp. Mn56C TaxID=3395261 RepID=UPI003BDE88EB
MRNLILVLVFTCAIGIYGIYSKTEPAGITETKSTTTPVAQALSIKDSTEAQKVYHAINLEGKLNYEPFEMAYNGYLQLPIRNKDIITVIDFSLPSTDKRMFVIDLKNKKLLFNSIVSHGKNSGEKYATSFSNKNGSYQSSLGFFVTENTYQGGNGFSLVLNGLEKGINDQAKPRAVVIHGADYCSQSVINATGRLGRSYGCPALPRELAKPIINTIKDGTMLFIYAQNKTYFATSRVLKASQSMLAQKDNDDESIHQQVY